MDDPSGDDTAPHPPVEPTDGVPPAPSIPPAGSRPLPPTPLGSTAPSVDPARSPSGASRTVPESAGADRYSATRRTTIQAPTAGWPRPPLSDSPPRPAPANPYSSLAGPPLPPEPAHEPVEPGGGLWRRVLKVAGVALVAVSLVSGGFALGTVLADDPESAQPTSNLTPAVDSETETGGTAGSAAVPLDVPGPLADEDDEDADEPVAAVAAAVVPSVVQIIRDGGSGSGIVWDASAGYIVTNDHVVGDAESVNVRAADGTVVVGEVVGGSDSTDVAVVQVDPSEIALSDAVFAPMSSVEVGQLAVAIGSPFDLEQTVTAGIVSAIRINDGGSDPFNPVPVEMIQTDAPINPGNSGGALADRQGRVIGMNTSIRTDGLFEGNIGIGFAVPSDTIVLIAQRIVNGESLELGYLGVSSREGGNGGVQITEVVSGSPADVAGLRVGDVIVGLDGGVMREIAELSAAIKLYRPGDVVEIEIERGGSSFTVEVELGALNGS
jgi:putative serine protease PepD